MPHTTESKYELTFILDETAGSTEGRAKTDELKTYITTQGGTVESEELWGRRELAYPIARNRSGFYVTLIFTIPAGQLPAMEQHLQFDVQVIRSLITQAYTTAQPGSLYPQVEEEQSGKTKEEQPSGEEMLRRSSGSRSNQVKSEEDSEAIVEELPEEERLKKLDETLDELLKEEE